jgi:hypothetical protein
MYPHHRRTAWASLTRFGIALLAVAAAQFTLSFSSFAVNAAEGGLYVTDLASGSVISYAADGTPTTFATDLISPQGIVFTQATSTMAAYFYVADAGDGGPTSGVIYRYDRAGNRTTFFTELNNPIGLAVASGDILVSENGAGRIRSIPIEDPTADIISEIVSNPLGIDAAAFDQSGFLSKFIATGDSVFRGDPGQNGTLIDIDPDDVSRSVGVDPVLGDVYVTTAAGTLSQLQPDGSSKVTFASGLTDPHGLAFVPPGNPAGIPSGIYVAETSGGSISRVLTNGATEPFVTDAGSPNFLAFQTISPPDPTPTPTPTPAPVVVTGVASNIGDTTATLNGTVNPSGSATTYQFQYGLTTSYGSTTPITSAGSGSTPVPVSAALTGLSPGTLYHFRVTATNGGGTANGADATFTTFLVPPTPTPTPTPIAVTGAASSIGNTTATLNGTVNPVGSDTTYQFQYGLTASYGSTTSIKSAGSGFTAVAASAALSGLSAGTVYHFRVTATNDGGTDNGEDATFTTTSTGPPAGKAQNLSTRVNVGTDANVGIGGFIITGSDPKLVVVRAIGPSLADFGITDPLADPVLELHDSSGDTIATNDNWMGNSVPDRQMLIDHGLAPTDGLESAIIKTLDPSLYTAVVSGKNGGTGVALVELYDLDDPGVAGEMANISTRGLVGTDANVMIGGVIVGPDGGLDAAVVVRAIGPSLGAFGITDPLADPVLELHNGDGDLIAMNDNWETDPEPDNYSAEVEAAELAPSDPSESAIYANLVPGLYTAIVSGKDATTGVGLVEVYHVAAQTANSSGH